MLTRGLAGPRRALERARVVLGASLEAFPPKIQRILRVEITAALLLAVFNCAVVPFTGLILRRHFQATPFQLAVFSAAAAMAMLPSLSWARLFRERPPLWFVVWFGAARADSLFSWPRSTLPGRSSSSPWRAACWGRFRRRPTAP